MMTMRRGMQSLFRTVSELIGGKKSLSGPSLLRKDQPATTNVTVIGLAIRDEDRRLLSSVSSRSQWNVVFADTCDEARAAIDRLRAPVILCDRDLPGEDWREVVEILASPPHRACIILVSKVVDDYLWNETVERGGYDVLPKPLREDDVVRAVRLAWSYWNSARRRAALPARHS